MEPILETLRLTMSLWDIRLEETTHVVSLHADDDLVFLQQLTYPRLSSFTSCKNLERSRDCELAHTSLNCFRWADWGRSLLKMFLKQGPLGSDGRFATWDSVESYGLTYLERNIGRM
ncbi:hypothetical protein NDU88_007699 [Pleurodeles waltl]|uniref:Uncharacterized protein n=1 Tax=Pleurodeles waltl TaxID=8319 RepID=A0AAV7U1W5_PLEWA|nr:hypothetical protein NDU88_007699 [Pleurodeles waltl]